MLHALITSIQPRTRASKSRTGGAGRSHRVSSRQRTDSFPELVDLTDRLVAFRVVGRIERRLVEMSAFADKMAQARGAAKRVEDKAIGRADNIIAREDILHERVDEVFDPHDAKLDAAQKELDAVERELDKADNERPLQRSSGNSSLGVDKITIRPSRAELEAQAEGLLKQLNDVTLAGDGTTGDLPKVSTASHLSGS